MHLKLKRIAPLQAGKILAALHGLLSLVFIPFVLVFVSIATLASRQGGNAPPIPFMFGMGLGMIVLLPVFYALMGFLGGVIGAFVYNLLAGWLGGFELEFEPTAPAPV